MNTSNRLPTSTDLMQIFWAVIDRWHEQESILIDLNTAEQVLTPQFSNWGALVEHIQLINTYQWHMEDKSRAAASDKTLTAVKRAIDNSNSRRIKAIETLDAYLLGALKEVGLPVSSAPLHSESPALIIDRMTILALKIYHLKNDLADVVGTMNEDFINIQLLNITEQFEDLANCLDRLFDDIAAGKTSIKMYRQIKIYDKELSD
jgi:hypothetical protein